MSFCKNCGAYIPDGQISCLACGFRETRQRENRRWAEEEYARRQAQKELQEEERRRQAEEDARRQEQQRQSRTEDPFDARSTRSGNTALAALKPCARRTTAPIAWNASIDPTTQTISPRSPFTAGTP